MKSVLSEKSGPIRVSEICPQSRSECKSITLWVPADCKDKFDRVQLATHKAYRKLLTDLVIEEIERIELDERAG